MSGRQRHLVFSFLITMWWHHKSRTKVYIQIHFLQMKIHKYTNPDHTGEEWRMRLECSDGWLARLTARTARRMAGPPNGPDSLPNGPDGPPNGLDGGAGDCRLRPWYLTRGLIMSVQSMEMMSYFLFFFGNCFRQFRGLKSQEMKYFLEIYWCGSVGMLSYQPYQPFV